MESTWFERPPKISNIKDTILEHLNQKTYRDTIHSQDRRHERQISLQEMIEVLRRGFHEKRKDKFDERWNSWNYAIRGKTDCASKELRVVVSFDDATEMLIITAIDLDL